SPCACLPEASSWTARASCWGWWWRAAQRARSPRRWRPSAPNSRVLRQGEAPPGQGAVARGAAFVGHRLPRHPGGARDGGLLGQAGGDGGLLVPAPVGDAAAGRGLPGLWRHLPRLAGGPPPGGGGVPGGAASVHRRLLGGDAPAAAAAAVGASGVGTADGPGPDFSRPAPGRLRPVGGGPAFRRGAAGGILLPRLPPGTPWVGVAGRRALSRR